jgi:hypothetical protein
MAIHGRYLIHADLSSSDTCKALGITIQSESPVLEFCRALIELGCDPDTPLECYRGDVLCLRVRSIGEAANLRISSDHSVEFKPLLMPAAASLMRSKRKAA